VSPTRIFVSYSREDGRWLDPGSPHGLIPWLARSLRRDHVETWYDRAGLAAGDEFQPRIEEEIDRADIAILLVSQAFLASEFIERVELPRIAARAAQGRLIAIPILVEPCTWQEVEFVRSRQMLPGKPTPLIDYTKDDSGWAHVRFEILREIRARLGKLRSPGVLPPPRATRRKGNLPSQLSPFVGRKRELPEVVGLLRDPGVRLLTLTGPGGVGKTRLAQEAGDQAAPDFPDGVWWAPLEDAREPEAVPAAMAAAVGIELRPDPSPSEQLLGALRGLELLLICDNFEQVLDGARLVHDLLGAAPGVKCLVTSRVPLRVRGEHIYEVAPMASPPPGAGLERVAGCDSVELFAERAREVRPGWELTAANAAAVAEICRRLDGLPMAIELAASRMGGMTPEEMLDRLENRMDGLRARGGDVRERQRSLRAVMDWSYDLLSIEERALLCDLSVFRGGFSAVAAAAVSGKEQALDLILELHSASLVTARQGTGRTRFGMLDVVREYARERLLQSGDTEVAALRRRHACYYREFAAQRQASTRTPGELAAVRELADETDNLRAALAWTLDHDRALAAALATAMYGAFTRLGLWSEALQCAARGLAAARETATTHVLPELLLDLASASHDRGALAEAKAHAEESLQLYRPAGDRTREATALNLLGAIALDTGDGAGSRTLHEDALELRRAAGDRTGEAVSLHNLGLVAQRMGDGAQAERRYADALAIRREVGDRRGAAETLCNLGVLAKDRGDDAAAASDYRAALEIWREFGDHQGMGLGLHNLGEIAAERGKPDQAMRLLIAAFECFRRLGSPLAAESEKLLQSLPTPDGDQAMREEMASARASEWEALVDGALNVNS
jgi:predicted ATPase